MTAKGDKSDVLLSSVQEILKESQEEIPVEPTAPPPAEEPTPVRQKKPAGGLLDALLSEVKEEAEREVQEITKTLEEKSAQEKAHVEEEEARKKAQYDKLIQEEARRRLQLIKRKEDEKKRKVEDEKLREEQKKAAAAQLVRAKKTRKVMLALAGVAGTGVVVVGVLIATGVIPLLVTPEVQETPVTAEKAPALPVEAAKAKSGDEAITGPVIEEALAPAPFTGIDGPAAPIIEIKARVEVDRSRVSSLPPSTQEPEISAAQMRTELARAFSRSGSSGGHSGSSGGHEDSGGIKIDDSIFRD